MNVAKIAILTLLVLLLLSAIGITIYFIIIKNKPSSAGGNTPAPTPEEENTPTPEEENTPTPVPEEEHSSSGGSIMPGYPGWKFKTNLVDLDTISASSNACQNLFYHGTSNVKFDTMLKATVTIDDGTPKSPLTTGSNAWKPYSYNPKYKYFWNLLWNTAMVKKGQKVCFELILGKKDTKEAQHIKQCYLIDKCGDSLQSTVLKKL